MVSCVAGQQHKFSNDVAHDDVTIAAMDFRTIEIAVALLSRSDGRTLVVRKRETETFIQPGGKLEAGEAPIDALLRELDEELGLRIGLTELTYAGRYEGPAVNEPECAVVAHAFYLTIDAAVTAAAEIEELVWIDPAAPTDLVLAPLTRDTFLPLLSALRR
jgi:8-oxo-dGTP diphosphatase